MTLFKSIAALALLVPALPAWAGMTPLIDPDDLARMVDDESAVILDIRSPAAYAGGHIEGAVNVPYPAWRGPEDNPGALINDEKLSLLLGEAGIEPDVPVVVTYAGKGTLDFGSAARVYWSLKSAGIEEIAILNGGLAEWIATGEPLSTEEASNFPSDLDFTFAQTWRIDETEIADIIAGRHDGLLIDARPEPFFTGSEKHPLARVAGTLAGAVNVEHLVWFDGNRLQVSPEQARAVAAAAGHDDRRQIISFCNTGHWAATNWFVLSEIAGLENVRLYPESLVGWTRANQRLASR